eukprot:Gb_24051 [translate_table: standard]
MAGEAKSSKKTPKVIQLTSENSNLDSTQMAAGNPVLAGLKLVGSIKEKGFSTDGDQSKTKGVSVPEPRVTPFPQARHRSEGPHWAPISSEPSDMVEAAEDTEDVGLESLAAFAHPIERKKKKALDFSHWKEKLRREKDAGKTPNDGGKKYKLPGVFIEEGAKQENLQTHNEINEWEKEESLKAQSKIKGNRTESVPAMPLTSKSSLTTCREMAGELPVGFGEKPGELVPISRECNFNEDTRCLASLQTDDTVPSHLHGLQFSMEMDRRKEKDKHPVERAINYKTEREGLNPKVDMEEIDAENRAALQAMSIEEIKEAQNELLERVQPEVLEMLKRRGEGKARRPNKGRTDLNTSQKLGARDNKKNVNISPNDGITESDTQASFPETRTTESENDHNILSTDIASNQWKIWTDRVEAVRTLRFSLDGNIVEPDIVATDVISLSQNGSNSDVNQLNIQNVAERDILRTEGDPASAGYTIKEAVALIRSMIPGQRAVALQLIGVVLDKALTNLQLDLVQSKNNICMPDLDKSVDWQAVWAYALGPEPGLILALRMALDDAHTTVVAACAKVLQCLLSCTANEYYFNLSESFWPGDKSLFSAPIFRRQSKFEEGFLGGGFWKYSAKPSNMFPFSDKYIRDDNEEETTVADDTTIAGQDVAAGLIRMGILPRIRYILEVEQAAEEPFLSVIIALARHSPTAADAVMKCPRLMDTIIQCYIIQQADIGVEPIQVKAVQLIRVLSQANRSNCIHFLESGVFQAAERHLLCYGYSLDGWLKLGQESFKSICAILVEELRLWKVCIQYGLCISSFSDFYPAICFWLSPPSYEKIIAKTIVNEVLSVARESYILLEVLARTLPTLHLQGHGEDDKTIFEDESIEKWSWSQVVPMIDVALNWLNFTDNPLLITTVKHFDKQVTKFVEQDSYRINSLGVISAVLHMLSTVCEKIMPLEDARSSSNDKGQPSGNWLPVFIPQLGLKIIKSKLLRFPKMKSEERFPHIMKYSSFAEYLCFLRKALDYGTSLSAVSCLHGLIRLITSVDKAINIAQAEKEAPCMDKNVSEGDEILKCGLVISSQNQLECILSMFMNLIASEWCHMQSCEMNGRGGPAPGIGLGWGATNGGYWSTKVLLAQADARVTAGLLEVFPIALDKGVSRVEKLNIESDRLLMSNTIQKINAAIHIVLLSGPRDMPIMEKTLSILFAFPVMKFLSFLVLNIPRKKAEENTVANIEEFDEQDYDVFSKVLQLQIKNSWLRKKKKNPEKNKTKAGPRDSSGNGNASKKPSLGTVYEEGTELESIPPVEYSMTLGIEWAHQRLPVPVQWLLSPLSTFVEQSDELLISGVLPNDINSTDRVFNIMRSGLFFLLGLETMSFYCDTIEASVLYIPLVRKIHTLSMVFILGGDVFLENRVRDLLGALQELYGQYLDGENGTNSKLLFERNLSERSVASKDGKSPVFQKDLGGCMEGVNLSSLDFERDIDDSYETFVETFTEHFGATSFGDVVYGRQVAIYLRRDVGASIRLATWNALANAHILELLPTLEECCAQPRGYLYPLEDHEKMIEAYVSSWVSGALDKAATRMSMTFSLALHHIAAFLFVGVHVVDRLSLRKKMARVLLLDSSRKPDHAARMIELFQYSALDHFQVHGAGKPCVSAEEIARRSKFLSEACEGDSLLLVEVHNLQSATQEKKI